MRKCYFYLMKSENGSAKFKCSECGALRFFYVKSRVYDFSTLDYCLASNKDKRVKKRNEL